MKRLIFVLIACSVGIASVAQTSAVYIKGGMNIANVSTTANGEVDKANALASFHVGLMADLPIGKIFAIQPGLLFTGKGSRVESGKPSDPTYYKATTNPLYIELPVNAVLKFPIAPSKNTNIFFGGGPYIAMGVAGKRKIEGKIAGVSFENKQDIEWSNDDPTTFNKEEGSGLGIMKRFDAGINATAGFQLNKILLSVNYGWGLTKLQSGAENNDNSNKNRVLGVSIGFGL